MPKDRFKGRRERERLGVRGELRRVTEYERVFGEPEVQPDGRTNKYAAKCAKCGEIVPAKEGTLIRRMRFENRANGDRPKFEVRHRHCI